MDKRIPQRTAATETRIVARCSRAFKLTAEALADDMGLGLTGMMKFLIRAELHRRGIE